jgi:hypothetical protein
MKTILFSITPVITLLCFLVSLFCLRPGKAGWWRLFVYFMALTAAVEVTGYVLYVVVKQQDNQWLFNLYLPLEISFFFYVLYRLCRNYFRPFIWLMGAWIIFMIIYLVESIGGAFEKYSFYANLFASVFIVAMAFIFYYSLMKQESHVELVKFPAFWIISGLFIFYLGNIGCTIFSKQLIAIYKKSGLPLRYIIFLMINFILYAFWSYAFLCRYQQKISSSP